MKNRESSNIYKKKVIIEDLQVVRTLGTTVDAASCEPLGKDLTLLFEHHGEALSLLQTVIRDEVNHTRSFPPLPFNPFPYLLIN